jgi:DNA-binding LacI/PurR family transcriptional regulator
MATMLDVSRKAGVAVSTVSRVLNGTAKISQATREAVFAAVDELNYRPNVIAQSLSKQQTNTIGLVIPRGVKNSQYLSQLIEECQNMADENGKFLLISQSEDQPDGAIRSILALVDRKCDAILYCHTSFFDQNKLNEDILSDLIDKITVPLVVMNCQLPRHPNHCVWIDNEKSAALPVEYLLQQGHQKIAYIAGPLHQQTAKSRMRGYQKALNQHNIELDPLLLAEAERGFHGGYLACQQLLQRSSGFTAICCFNDQMAIGAVKALHEAGLCVPEDVSLFGLDNEDILEFFEPSICSVSRPTHKFVIRAVELLMAHLNGLPLSTSTDSCFSGELTLRESVRAL